MNKHTQLARVVIAGALDFPEIITNDDDVSRVQAYDMPDDLAPVWRTMVELHNDGGLSISRLVDKLPAELGFDVRYFYDCQTEHSGARMDDVRAAALSIRRHSNRYGIAQIASGMIQAVQTERSPEEIALRAIDDLSRLSIDPTSEVTHIGAIAGEVYEAVSERAKNPTEVWGMPTGLDRFDKAMGGLEPTTLTILAGEPGIGKTWLLCQMALEFAKHAPGVFFSMEMTKAQIVRRFLAINGVNSRNMRTGNMDAGDWMNIDNAIAAIEKLPMDLYETRFSLSEVRAIIAKKKKTHNISWFLLDYALMVNEPGDEMEVSARVSRELKSICKEQNVAGILISSVTKAGMDNAGAAAASKGQIRGNGQQIHDADNILFLTKFDAVTAQEKLMVMPAEAERMVTLWVKKGRELENPNQYIHLRRIAGTPKFGEVVFDGGKK